MKDEPPAIAITDCGTDLKKSAEATLRETLDGLAFQNTARPAASPVKLPNGATKTTATLHTHTTETCAAALLVGVVPDKSERWSQSATWDMVALCLAALATRALKKETAPTDKPDLFEIGMNAIGESALFLRRDGGVEIATSSASRLLDLFRSCERREDWPGCPVHALIVELCDKSDASAQITRFHNHNGKRYHITSANVDAETESENLVFIRIKETPQEDESVERLVFSAHKHSIAEFASAFAHDINNPMTTIFMRVGSLLQSPRLGESEREDAQRIQNAAQRASVAAQQLEDFAKTDADDKHGPIDLNGIIENTLLIFLEQSM